MDLSRIIIFTGDVRRMVDFYGETFGLEVVGEFDSVWTELNAGGCNIAFHSVPFDVTATEDDGLKVVFSSDDVPAEKARLESLGIEMTKIFEFGDIQMCDGSDPDGHRFQISSRGVK